MYLSVAALLMSAANASAECKAGRICHINKPNIGCTTLMNLWKVEAMALDKVQSGDAMLAFVEDKANECMLIMPGTNVKALIDGTAYKVSVPGQSEPYWITPVGVD